MRYLAAQGLDVVGIENDMRSRFFGPEASTAPVTADLEREVDAFTSIELDIRDAEGVERLFRRHAGSIEVVVHTAAQPSHDWAAREPQTDFAVNANGTLNLLEAARTHAPTRRSSSAPPTRSTATPPTGCRLTEHETRLELPESHRYSRRHRQLDVDRPLAPIRCSGPRRPRPTCWCRSTAATSSMPTVCFRGGCLTGPQHAGAQLHGFLAYLMKCVVTGTPYTVFGYDGKQVRDNIHSADLVAAFEAFREAPRPAAVYNIGGGPLRELLDAGGDRGLRADRRPRARVGARRPEPRIGDHRWWISDLGPFEADYPDWSLRYGIEEILTEIYERNAERWLAGRA